VSARAHVDPGAIPPAALWICQTLQARGHRAWVVGGCVRDHLLGRPVADWDVCTSARPDVLMAVFPKAIPTGIAHGTVTVVRDRAHYEVTTLRGDGDYADGRRPDAVRFLDDIDEDLARRDFTVNAIAYDPLARELADPFDGRGDIHRRTLRAVGDPLKRFGEDGLRVLRGARFVATLGFTLHPETEAAIAPSLDVFRRVSAERVRDEWMKAMKAPAPSHAFAVMRRTGILGVTAPALAALPDAAWRDALAALDGCDGPAALRVAALLHPLADALPTVDAWLKQYRYSNEERAVMLHALKHHRTPSADLDGAALRRWLRAVGVEHLDAVFLLARTVAALGEGAHEVAALEARARAALAAGVVLSTRDLAVDGAALMAHLGIPPSRRLGELLTQLLERVTDDPALNEREALLDLARSLIAG
jgi:tRNA nucleotidyltransferase (CCA-adding enzyme)